VIFTFMLASFPAGLVIYWAWNNLLSVIQQSVIMRKHGAKIELWDNLKSMFKGSDKSNDPPPSTGADDKREKKAKKDEANGSGSKKGTKGGREGDAARHPAE
jgi:membrane protein insertase Oxa1/YidC/SpoIIIJ